MMQESLIFAAAVTLVFAIVHWVLMSSMPEDEDGNSPAMTHASIAMQVFASGFLVHAGMAMLDKKD